MYIHNPMPYKGKNIYYKKYSFEIKSDPMQ